LFLILGGGFVGDFLVVNFRFGFRADHFTNIEAIGLQAQGFLSGAFQGWA
jgi:hypothetical protein